ncbi:SufD family Fe-S cluster assembly protein [Mycoplasma sp. P36-A1]|uniref:SufD family Fe-S cluster assembly protein n=1 Tax=Mycoplasma sp. P36-A1 TaxID=3252900 RepID=UPI003C30EB01
MKYFLKVNQDKVSTNLEFKDSEKIIVNVEKSGQLEMEITNPSKIITLVFAKDTKVNITKVLNFTEGKDEKINIEYLLNTYSNVNEFLTTIDSNASVDYAFKAVLSDYAVLEISNGQFSDTSSKFDIEINLNGVNSKALHNIAAISRLNQEKVYNVTINNNARETYGELNNFGVVKNEAKLIFNGTGYIKNGAKQSIAHQASKIITFDPNVEAQANPFLIIDEADVEASHAAAVGQMDEEQLFYLQSRGLDSEHASKLITYGYLKPILTKISDDSLKKQLEKLIEEKVGL